MLNIFKAFKSRNLNETKALLAALYKMMLADDVTKKEEADHFWSMCKEKGLNQDDIQEVISQCSRICMNVPTDIDKQKEFLDELVYMMRIDGVIRPSEMALLKQYAEMMGFAIPDDLPLEEWCKDKSESE